MSGDSPPSRAAFAVGLGPTASRAALDPRSRGVTKVAPGRFSSGSRRVARWRRRPAPGPRTGSLNRKRPHSPMLLILVAMLVVMALAALVAAYVAYPERGEPIPHAAWLSDKLFKLRDRIDP